MREQYLKKTYIQTLAQETSNLITIINGESLISLLTLFLSNFPSLQYSLTLTNSRTPRVLLHVPLIFLPKWPSILSLKCVDFHDHVRHFTSKLTSLIDQALTRSIDS